MRKGGNFIFLEKPAVVKLECKSLNLIYLFLTLIICPPADTFDIDLSSLGEDISRTVECETADQSGTASSAVVLQPADSSLALTDDDDDDLSDEEEFEFITTEDL